MATLHIILRLLDVQTVSSEVLKIIISYIRTSSEFNDIFCPRLMVYRRKGDSMEHSKQVCKGLCI